MTFAICFRSPVAFSRNICSHLHYNVVERRCEAISHRSYKITWGVSLSPWWFVKHLESPWQTGDVDWQNDVLFCSSQKYPIPSLLTHLHWLYSVAEMYFMMKTKFEFPNSSWNLSNASYSTCDVLDNSFAIQISKIVVFSIILLCGLGGNALIASIVYNRKELRKTVNLFIVNMAISDFAFRLTGIPLKLVETVSGSRQWPISDTLGLITCKLKWYFKDVSITVSVESLVWIALDRFVAVVVPSEGTTCFV